MGAKYYCSRAHFLLNYCVGLSRCFPKDLSKCEYYSLAEMRYMLFDVDMKAYSFDKFTSKKVPHPISAYTWMQFL
jgi:hypothetical protein